MPEQQQPQIEQISIDALMPYARNSRTHSTAQIAQLVASINEFGFTNPVLIDEANGIIAGHGRVLAATQLGMQDVPCLRLSHLTEAQRRAYVIADNKLALNAGWDYDVLKDELAALDDADFDLELTGLSDAEIKSALGEVEEVEAEAKISATLQYRIVIECESEAHQAKILKTLEREGLSCQPLIS